MDSSSGFWYLKLMHIDFNIELWHSLVIKLSRTVNVYFLMGVCDMAFPKSGQWEVTLLLVF